MRYQSKKTVRKFYQQWNKPVFTLCFLFLGDKEREDEATGQAFLLYLRKGLPLERTHLPEPLLQCAVEALKQHCIPPPSQTKEGFESAILSLPCEQRLVFILRSVLRMQEPSVAVVTAMPTEQVRKLWTKALLGLCSYLQSDFLKEHKRDDIIESFVSRLHLP